MSLESKLIAKLTDVGEIQSVWDMGVRSEVFEEPPMKYAFEFIIGYWQKSQEAPSLFVIETEIPGIKLDHDPEAESWWLAEKLNERYFKNAANEILIKAAAAIAKNPERGLKQLLGQVEKVCEIGSTPDQLATLEHVQAVEAELDRQRVREEARRILAAEKAGPALGFEWGLLDNLDDCDEEPYRIEGLLPAHGGMVVVAQRKAGKTTLLLNLARCLITGEAFLNRFDTQAATGRVAILNYEVSGPQLSRWARHTGIPGDQLFMVNLRGRRNPLLQREDRAQLAAKLQEHSVETLIVDPFGRAYTGSSQNDPAEVGAWLADLDVFARSEVGAKEVILAVHAGWNGERTRGSSAIEDWADSIVTMTFGNDRQSRYLRAIGRDVSVDEDRLHYDPVTRLLSMTGTGGRTEFERIAKTLALVDPVCQYLGANAAASQGAIVKGMRELRKNGDIAVAFQDVDVRAAIELAEKQGRLRRETDGPGKATRHYLVASENTLSKATLSGQGQ